MSQRSEIANTGMRPQMGQTTLVLPITFDYQGGRGAKRNSQRLWAAIVSIVAIIIGIGTMTRKQGFFLTNIIIGLILLYSITFIVRFFILKEGIKRREEITTQDNDFKLKVREIWGIYDIGSIFPYICRFRNGKSGIIVRLNKDVILGKYSESEYEHYEAISDAYNICGSSKIQMCHVDYMDNIGMDERLDYSFANLGNSDNEELKDLLTDIFTYQKLQMLERVTTFDVYVFMWKGSDISAWSTIQDILSCFMEANYRSYQVLNEHELGELSKTIFNLMDFSVINATLNAFDDANEVTSGISAIQLKKADGEVIKLGKTIEEKKKEAELEVQKQEIRKNIKAEKGKKSSKTIEEIDLDEEIDL